jgi:hypothetical protein
MRGRLLRWQKPPDKLVVEQIAVNQVLQQFITIQLANHASGIVIVGNIGGIFSQKITNDLINGIVTLLAQGIKNALKD